MVGELLYHLHRHFRLVLVVGGLALIVGAVMLGCEVARHMDGPSTRPVSSGRA